MKLDKKKTILMGIILVIAVVIVYVYLYYFRTFTVTFNVRLGVGIKTQEVRINKQVVRPEDPVYEGYTFIGWFVDGEEYDFTSPVTSDLIITAEWEENK